MDSRLPIWSRASRYIMLCVLKRLPTLIAVWLISSMIVGFVAGILFFSYKIGVESKDAVISVKEHVQKSNYAEHVGLKQWINDNNIPELMDTYTVKFYESVSKNMDAIARQYNMTEFADSFKHYLLTRKPANDNFTVASVPSMTANPFTLKLQSIRVKAQNRDFRAILAEVEALFRLFKDVQISRDDLLLNTKNFTVQSMDVINRVFASSIVLFTGGTNLVLSVVVSIASGAAGIFYFLSQSMVFFWLLYYLITSESGGVLEHVLDMLPESKKTRSRCAEVLDRAVSSVLLATAKMAFFQAAVTWLLFRFFQIHFLYMSTLLAFTSALLPIFPPWVSSLPAGLQMAVEGQYLQGIVLTIIHLWIMDYGVTTIQCDVPGQNAYLTGLSIIGGMAVFSPALEMLGFEAEPCKLEENEDEEKVKNDEVSAVSWSKKGKSGSKRWMSLKDFLYRSKSEGRGHTREKLWALSFSASPAKQQHLSSNKGSAKKTTAQEGSGSSPVKQAEKFKVLRHRNLLKSSHSITAAASICPRWCFSLLESLEGAT